MSRITQISILILVLGTAIGLFTGGLSGMIIVLFFSIIIAIAFYCIANTFKSNAVSIPLDPFNDVPTQIKNDRSQLPKSAYDMRGTK